MKLNNFNKDKSSIALILTSILSVFLFTFNDSDLLIFFNSLRGDSKKIILKPKTDLDAFLVYKDTFKKQVIENIQVKLSSNSPNSLSFVFIKLIISWLEKDAVGKITIIKIKIIFFMSVI